MWKGWILIVLRGHWPELISVVLECSQTVRAARYCQVVLINWGTFWSQAVYRLHMTQFHTSTNSSILGVLLMSKRNNSTLLVHWIKTRIQKTWSKIQTQGHTDKQTNKSALQCIGVAGAVAGEAFGRVGGCAPLHSPVTGWYSSCGYLGTVDIWERPANISIIGTQWDLYKHILAYWRTDHTVRKFEED